MWGILKLRTKKLILSVLVIAFCLFLVLGLIGYTENKNRQIATIEFGYEYSSDLGGYVIISAKNAKGEVNIPQTYTVNNKTYPVVAIGKECFWLNKEIIEVKIPATIKVICDSAFESCKNLKRVIIKEDSAMQRIGCYAFKWCTNLKTINLPSKLEILDSEAFCACPSLLDVVLPKTLRKLGYACFYECEQFTEIEIPAKITTIESWAFFSCYNLRSIKFADGINLEVIGDYAFRNCVRLVGLRLPSTVKHLGAYAFYWCDNLEWLLFGNYDEGDYSQLETISSSAFNFCYNLSMINIPKSLKSLGASFYNCTALTNIQYEGKKADWELIEKHKEWRRSIPATHIWCRDVGIPLRGQAY